MTKEMQVETPALDTNEPVAISNETRAELALRALERIRLGGHRAAYLRYFAESNELFIHHDVLAVLTTHKISMVDKYIADVNRDLARHGFQLQFRYAGQALGNKRRQRMLNSAKYYYAYIDDEITLSEAEVFAGPQTDPLLERHTLEERVLVPLDVRREWCLWMSKNAAADRKARIVADVFAEDPDVVLPYQVLKEAIEQYSPMLCVQDALWVFNTQARKFGAPFEIVNDIPFTGKAIDLCDRRYAAYLGH